MASSTLDTIRQKVRRITRSPSTAQLSNVDLDQYINTFIENDMPTSVKLFSLRTVLTFYTQPGVDVYATNSIPNDPLNNFKNKYTAIHPPIYIAGVAAFFTQDRDIFYGNWPQTNAVQQTGLFGNGGTGPFAGILPPPNNLPGVSIINPHILQRSVMFSALDVAGTSMIVVDTPTSNVLGNLTTPNSVVVLGTINYVTGAYSFSFPNSTALTSVISPNPIWSEAIYYVAGLPTTVLYYDNQFTLRPVPDKAYIVQVEANIRPTELLQTTDVPQISQWSQWISWGAAIKIFQDRMDMDSVQLSMPEFERQQAMVLSTSMEQYTNQRTVTIYTDNGLWSACNNWGRWPYIILIIQTLNILMM